MQDAGQGVSQITSPGIGLLSFGTQKSAIGHPFGLGAIGHCFESSSHMVGQNTGHSVAASFAGRHNGGEGQVAGGFGGPGQVNSEQGQVLGQPAELFAGMH